MHKQSLTMAFNNESSALSIDNILQSRLSSDRYGHQFLSNGHQQITGLIKYYKIQSFGLNHYIEQLNEKAGQRSNNLYGVPLFDKQGNRLMPNKWHLVYLISCFKLMKWQSVSPEDLLKYISEIPHISNPFDSIQISNQKLKMSRQNYTLVYEINSSQIYINQKVEQSNYLQKGKVVRSLTKVSIDDEIYTSQEMIRQVERYENLTTIRTDSSISLYDTNGNFKQLPIEAEEIKWHERRLYILCRDHLIRSIEKDQIMSNIRNCNHKIQENPLNPWKQGEFIIKTNQGLVLIFVQPSYIAVRKIGGYYQRILFENNYRDIVYQGGCCIDDTIHVIVIVNTEGTYECIEAIICLN